MENDRLNKLINKLPEYRKMLLRDGFVRIPQVFSVEEIEEIRKKAYLSVGYDYIHTDLLSNPVLRDVLFDPRILACANGLHDEKPVYFGESKVLVDPVNGRDGGSIHKDNPDRLNPDGPDWEGEYGVIRFALFCQDHSQHSEGISVRQGSHRIKNDDGGKLIHVPSKPGDLVAFYFTTTHCGYSQRYKLKNLTIARDNVNRPFWTKLMKRIPSFLKVPREKNRIVLFASFARKGPHFDRYIEYCKRRDYAIRYWKKLEYSEDTWEFVKDKNVEVMDMSDIPNQVDMDKVGTHFESGY